MTSRPGSRIGDSGSPESLRRAARPIWRRAKMTTPPEVLSPHPVSAWGPGTAGAQMLCHPSRKHHAEAS